MEIGTLYYLNDSKKSSCDIILEILEQYQTKYGLPPQVVEVHYPQTEKVKLPDGMKVVVRAQRYILPNHFLVGQEE